MTIMIAMCVFYVKNAIYFISFTETIMTRLLQISGMIIILFIAKLRAPSNLSHTWVLLFYLEVGKNFVEPQIIEVLGPKMLIINEI